MDKRFVTTEDLHEFRAELMEDFKKLMTAYSGLPPRKWLRSQHVCQILLISPGTLRNLRVNGILPFTKIGGLIYYDYTDIQEVLRSNKLHKR
jgi:hypothetical protein